MKGRLLPRRLNSPPNRLQLDPSRRMDHFCTSTLSRVCRKSVQGIMARLLDMCMKRTMPFLPYQPHLLQWWDRRRTRRNRKRRNLCCQKNQHHASSRRHVNRCSCSSFIMLHDDGSIFLVFRFDEPFARNTLIVIHVCTHDRSIQSRWRKLRLYCKRGTTLANTSNRSGQREKGEVGSRSIT